jgi:hypothetical protein
MAMSRLLMLLIWMLIMAIPASAGGRDDDNHDRKKPEVSAARATAESEATAKSKSAAAAVSHGGSAAVGGDTTKVYASPPTVFAPGLTTGNDVCVGAVSAGAAGGNGIISAGLSFGSTYTDENCVRLKNAHALFAMGHKEAALAVLAKNKDVADALKAAGVKVATLPPEPQADKVAPTSSTETVRKVPAAEPTQHELWRKFWGMKDDK